MMQSELEAAAAQLDAEGYCLFPNVVPAEVLTRAQRAYQRMLAKVENGAYPHFRVYDDYIPLNVAGIEHIFSPGIFEPDIFSAIVASGLLPKAKLLFGTKRPAMILNRIHCTTRYSHTGIWHRDADAGTEPHLQMALFLYDETRFIVVPGSQRRESTDEEIRRLGASRMAELPGQKAIGGRAGDLMYFKSSILHRGSCIEQRAHIHFRIGSAPVDGPYKVIKEEGFSRADVLDLCDDHWLHMFTSCMQDGRGLDPQNHGTAGHGIARLAKRVAATALHHGLFFLPESSPVFNLIKWVGPNLRLRQRLRLLN